MDKIVLKTMRRDCHRFMWSCYMLCGAGKLLALVAPTLAAGLLGGMTDALLTLDVNAIRRALLPFLGAVFLEAIVMRLIGTLSSLLLVRQGSRYEAFLVSRFLRRPLTALAKETGATVAQHVIWDTPDYYFTQIWKFTLPVVGLVYGLTLLGVLFARALHPIFTAVILLLAALPLLRTVCIGKLNARLTAETRNYETGRAKDEETMFSARSFLRANRLTKDALGILHSRFEDWFSSCATQKNTVAAVRVVFDYLCSYGAALGVIFAGALLIHSGAMSVGALMTGYLLLPTLTSFYQDLAGQLEEIRKEKDKQTRLTVFYGETAQDLAETEEALPTSCPQAEEIRLEKVSFAYPGADKNVLTDWSGRFPRRETIRISGENGSGKTTLTSLLSGLYAPQSGAVTDEAGDPLSKEALRRLVTIQEQNGSLFQGTVWENLFAGPEQQREAQELLTELGFGKAMDHPVSPGGSDLSPGERQKLLIARALLRSAGFLILDEPLNHLDAVGRDALLARLEQRKSGLILISHQVFPLISREICIKKA